MVSWEELGSTHANTAAPVPWQKPGPTWSSAWAAARRTSSSSGKAQGSRRTFRGEPFVGPAGKLLDMMLSLIDLERSNVYIANIVKCRPPKNRDPLNTEQDACIGYLRAQTALLRPKIIVCLAESPPCGSLTKTSASPGSTASGSTAPVWR